jgi:CBS-domain-containing membrane protein
MSTNNKTDTENAEWISDSDIYQAMEEMSGYVDITLEDFREIYRHAYQHAHKKVSLAITGDATGAARAVPSGREDRKTVPSDAQATVCSDLKNYFKKMQGSEHSPPRVGLMEIGWSWAGAFLGIALVAYCNFRVLDQSDLMLLVGSFGASAVLIYGAIKSPLAQPRNLIGGHVLSALIGVACYQGFSFNPWLASALAVATAIAVMHATKMLHPPGGATALIAVIGSEQIHALGYLYALIPVGLGALMMLAVALVVNNIPHSRRYPEFWI